MSRSVSPALQVIAVLGVTWYSGLLGSAWDSWSQHYSRIQVEKVRVAAIREDGYELVFKNVCPDFYDLSWIGRQFSTLGWCNDYRNRF